MAISKDIAIQYRLETWWPKPNVKPRKKAFFLFCVFSKIIRLKQKDIIVNKNKLYGAKPKLAVHPAKNINIILYLW